MDLKRQLGLPTAIFVVVASMIGTGIFTTTGDILSMNGDIITILIVWLVGGSVAITGAMCYAELATMWPEVGGEYVYLKKIFGLLPSFLTGWISLFVGFSATVAVTGLAFTKYFSNFLKIFQEPGSSQLLLSGEWESKILISVIFIAFGLFHIVGVRIGTLFQNTLTVLKLIIIISIIGVGFYFASWNSGLTEKYTVPHNIEVSQFNEKILSKINSNKDRENALKAYVLDRDKKHYILTNKLNVPNSIQAAEFENNVLSKIQNDQDKNKLISYYKKEKQNNKLYVLKKNINNQDKVIITGILKSAQFKLDQDFSSTIPTIGLIFLMIMFTYSGWNGASYIAGEIKNPNKNLPVAMVASTLLITIIYF
ncbi:MAG: amino acid permease, partial [Spirochaetota bacterium]|nr:amino acid permease [Spirochaetota bacterium]